MDAVTYRRARPDDWDAVMGVFETANFHHVPSAEMPSFDLSCCFVAELDGAIAGAAGYGRMPDGRGKTTLMAVKPGQRGLLIGQRLQELRMLAMRDAGCRVVVTNADLPETIAWYKRKFGYREVGRLAKLHAFGAADRDHWTTLEADIEHWHRHLYEGDAELEAVLKRG
ncbi:MAG TPA: GNAT family N-acetyltransferase [Thermoleophilaceae bacterium]|nr:GNAT family N-acetyltransferase [Thermoleophilaceae bacterium]